MVTELAQGGLFRGMHKGMALTSAALVLAFVLFTGFGSDTAGSVFGAARAWIEGTFIVLSRYGSLRLAADDSRAEFSDFAWFSMLFSAGIGIGIGNLFFGIAEPVFYLMTAALCCCVKPSTTAV